MTDSTPAPALHRTALFPDHLALGAKLVDFGGWEMPLAYPGGTLTEHRTCRTAAVVFDVSHLGTVRIEGPGSFDHLQVTLSNDLRRVEVGRAQYTHLLDDRDGSVVDDIIVWWRDEESFDVMPNASSTDAVVGALGGRDVTTTRTVLAVQGPEARARLAAISPDAAAIGRFRVGEFTFAGVTGTVAGTGYTGEDGVELAVPNEIASELWGALLNAGVVPAGLGARDTLRLEAGLPLYGHELGPGITPLQASLSWVVGWDKEAFRGRDALLAERTAGPRRHLVGLATEGRQPLRQGAEILLEGTVVGSLTSGNFSPMLGHAVGLGLVEGRSRPEPGTDVEIEQRGRRTPATVVALPFVRAGQFA